VGLRSGIRLLGDSKVVPAGAAPYCVIRNWTPALQAPRVDPVRGWTHHVWRSSRRACAGSTLHETPAQIDEAAYHCRKTFPEESFTHRK
jgi:hypothetical protein